jgi:hypothetical protein
MGHIGKYLLNKRTLVLMTSQFLFLVAFNFLNIGSVYKFIAFAILIPLYLLFINRLPEQQKTDSQLMLMTILIYAIFTSLSPLMNEQGNIMYHVIGALGILSFYVIGTSLRVTKAITLNGLLKILLLGVGLLTFIGFTYTVFRYLPFYRLLFQQLVIYVDGEVYLVSSEAKWLFGLAFKEVNPLYVGMYGVSLVSLLFPLVFIPFRSLGKKDIWWLSLGGLGLSVMIFFPLLEMLIFIIPLGIVVAIIKFYPIMVRYKKMLLGLKIASLSLLFILVTLFFLDTWNLFSIQSLIAGIPGLRSIYSFHLIERYQSVLRSSFQYPFGGFAPIFVGNQLVATTYSIFFDTLHQGGIFAFFGLVFFMMFSFLGIIEYVRLNKNISSYLTISFLSGFFFYVTFSYILFPFVRETERYVPIVFIEEPLFIVSIVLLGYLMVDPFGGFAKKKKLSSKSRLGK